MENKIDLKRLVRMRGKTQEEYATSINITKLTLIRRFENPLKLTIEQCIQSDKCLQLPNGTTYAVINGDVMFNDINEYING